VLADEGLLVTNTLEELQHPLLGVNLFVLGPLLSNVSVQK